MDQEALKLSVSIIVPVYNVAPYIEDCLQSVMHQTFNGCIECLLIDDCGTDDSIVIAERMIATYVGAIRFQILHHKYNRGLSAARNTGTMHAIGNYLYYLDSDDEITEDCIECLIKKVAEYPDVEMVQGNAVRHLNQKGPLVLVREISMVLAESNDEVRKCRYQYGQIYENVWNKLLKRDLVVKNQILCKEGLLFEDNLWIFLLVRHLQKAAFVNEVTYHQKKRPNSITTSADKKTEGHYYYIIYQEILGNLTSGHERDEFHYYAKIIASLYLRYMHYIPAFKNLFQECRKMCRQYGNRPLSVRLAVFYFLGYFKYGWVVVTLLVRVKHPCLILQDFKRVRGR